MLCAISLPQVLVVMERLTEAAHPLAWTPAHHTWEFLFEWLAEKLEEPGDMDVAKLVDMTQQLCKRYGDTMWEVSITPPRLSVYTAHQNANIACLHHETGSEDREMGVGGAGHAMLRADMSTWLF